MLDWARGAGKPHNLWHANMVLLLLASNLGLHEEALRRAEELKGVDANDPYLLEMIARVYETQGRQSEATTYARKAVQKAELEDPLIRESYEEYLRHLLASNDGQEFTSSAG